MGAGILPVALYQGTLFLLLGQERFNNLWCDFGGRAKKRENTFDTAVREGSEELNGLFGTEKELEISVNKKLITSIYYERYTSYLFNIRYSKDLPIYFSNINYFAEKHLPNLINNDDNGLFEKIKIKWFPLNDFKNEKNKIILRQHYIEIINSIIKNEEFIIKQIKLFENI